MQDNAANIPRVPTLPVVASERSPSRPIRGEGLRTLLLITIVFFGLIFAHHPSRYFFFGDSWGALYSFLVNWRAIFKPHGEHLMPLFFIPYFLEYKVFGARHLPYELVEFGLHAVNAGLVYRLGRRFQLRAWPSVGAALIFAFSWVHWEVTGWSFEQCFVLATLWMLMAIQLFWENPKGNSELLGVAVLSLAALWSGPIALALPLVLTGSYGLWWNRAGEPREPWPRVARSLAAVWCPAVIYAASLRATIPLDQVLAMNQTHLGLSRIPAMIQFTLRGVCRDVVLQSLNIRVFPTGSSFVAFLVMLGIVAIFPYRSLPSSAQHKAFWFLLWMMCASYFTISIGRAQHGPPAPRYTYFPLAGGALLLALCCQALRDAMLKEQPRYLVNALGAASLAYFLVFYTHLIRAANPAADRGLETQRFLSLAEKATFPPVLAPGAIVLGPEMPVPPYVSTPGYRPLWEVFRVLEGNTHSVAPVGEYLRNKDASLAGNLVRDGGFETAAGEAGWTIDGAGSFQERPEAALHGQGGVEVKLAPEAAFSEEVLNTLAESLPQEFFTVSIHAKTAQKDALEVRIIFKDASGKVLDVAVSKPASGDGQWDQLVISGLSPAGTRVVDVDILNASSSQGKAMLDDAILVAHPGTVDANGHLHFANAAETLRTHPRLQAASN